MATANQEPLTLVNNDLVAITALVGSAMNLATQSLLDVDLSLAEKVIQADANIDALCSAVEDRCLELMEDKRPTGSELRSIIGALRIAASLERMGDLAEHVAKQARMRYPHAAVPQDLRETFAIMGHVAEAIVSKSGAVIATKNVSLASEIASHEAEMDHLHRELFTIMLSPFWAHGVEAAIDVTLLSRYYERYADHAVSMTRRVINVVTGEPYVAVDFTT